MRRKIFNKLMRALCAVFGHPLYQDIHFGGHECLCGKRYR